MFRPLAIWNHFKSMHRYIAFSFILFFAGIILGGTNPAFKAFLDSQIAGMQQLVGMVNESSNPEMTMLIVIFLNNAIKSIFIMYLGAFFGLIPLLFLVINGMVIGYMLQMIAELPEGPHVWEVILKGLLPHGIIEIPAIIIACAYGLRFGMLSFKTIGSLLFARGKLGSVGRELEGFVVRTLPVMVFLTVALLIASVIESTITVWLLSM